MEVARVRINLKKSWPISKFNAFDISTLNADLDVRIMKVSTCVSVMLHS